MVTDDARCAQCGALASSYLCAACEYARLYEQTTLEQNVRHFVYCLH